MDGELSGQDARRVAELVETDPDWRADFEQFRAVGQLTGLLEPARPRRDLTDGIVRSATRRKGRLVRVVRIVAPLAAAACIILAVRLGSPPPKSVTEGPPAVGVEAQIAAILKDVLPEDRFIVRNLPLFRNYDEVSQYQQVRDLADAETLSALAEMENEEM